MNAQVLRIITPDTFDWRQYAEETDAQVKVQGAETWKDDLLASVRNGVTVVGAQLPWAKTHDHLRFRAGEVTLWQGINGHGKSQLTGMAVLGFMRAGEGACIASFEMKPVSTLRRMLRQVAMNDRPSEDMASRFIDWCEGRLWLYDQQGTVKPEMIYGLVKYCARELKIKHVVVDSLMKCVKGEDDYNGQKDFVDTLTGLARDERIHVHLVHHVRKGENEEKPPGKFDAKGSGAITDQVDQVLTVWRNKKKEKAMESAKRQNVEPNPKDVEGPDAMLICDKNRHGEWEGSVALWYHPGSLQYLGDSRGRPINFLEEQS